MKTKCDYLNGWTTHKKKKKKKKNRHIRKNVTQNGDPQRHSWGTRRRHNTLWPEEWLGQNYGLNKTCRYPLIYFSCQSPADWSKCMWACELHTPVSYNFWTEMFLNNFQEQEVLKGRTEIWYQTLANCMTGLPWINVKVIQTGIKM